MDYVALYLRLSVEDEDDKDESNSICNQRKLIMEYIQHNLELNQYETIEFCDDGYSGTHMERPGMQKMLKEIKAKSIRCIIVKDMSRFSRDYIEMGTYLNQIFPFMGIRFIAINDYYDSRNYGGNVIEIDTAFRTLLYDLYSKDISIKVKRSIENKCAKGEYVFGQVPFGYEKSKEEKNAIIVNEKEAEIVRYIFSLAVQGMSSVQIATCLHEKKIPTITQMRKSQRKDNEVKIGFWSDSVIRNILNNRFYVGEMLYGKTVRKAVGSTNGISVPRQDWKVIQKHHEALISQEIFDQVSRKKTQCSRIRSCEKHLLAGKIFCGGCGYSLTYKQLKGKNVHGKFECRKHALLQIDECCTYINAGRLEEIVLCALRKEILIRGDVLKQKEKFISLQSARIHSLHKEIEVYRQETKKIENKKIILYEEYALGRLKREEYQKNVKEMTGRLSQLLLEIEKAMSELTELNCEYQKVSSDKEQIIHCLHMDKLTQEVVDIFINKIYVYKGKRVKIDWNFRCSS